MKIAASVIGLACLIFFTSCQSTQAGREPAGLTGENSSSAEKSAQSGPSQKNGVADAQKGQRVFIAIVDFAVLGGDAELKALAADIPQTLTGAFLKGGRLRPVERIDMEKALAELELSMSALADQDAALKLGKIVGAQYILLGSVARLADQVKLSCRVISTQTAEIVYTEQVRGSFSAIFELEEELAQKVEKGLNL